MTPDVPAPVHSGKSTSAEMRPSRPVERAAHEKRRLSLELLLAFTKMYGVIEDYVVDGDSVVIRRLGARYRVESAHAHELLLRMLRERPPLAELALTMCFESVGVTPLREEDRAGA
jgi:hypothetical protein